MDNQRWLRVDGLIILDRRWPPPSDPILPTIDPMMSERFGSSLDASAVRPIDMIFAARKRSKIAGLCAKDVVQCQAYNLVLYVYLGF